MTEIGMFADRVVVSCIPGLAGLIGILKISIKHRLALVGMCWLQGILGSPVVLNWTLPGLNTAGHTKRTTVIGIYFVYVSIYFIYTPRSLTIT